MGGNVALLNRDPDGVAQRVAAALDQITHSAGDELVYSPTSPNGYYRDLVAQRFSLRGVPGAAERLKRHAEQMDRVRKTWHEQALRRLWSGGVEYRVTPDRTDGFGGYFAPPLWLVQLFATANRAGRVLSGLMQRFPLPAQVGELHLPRLTTGTKAEPAVDDAPVVDRDIEDAEASSAVVPFTGQADVALQLLEQSPAGAHLDWAIFMDLAEAFDEDLEVELLEGTGGQRGLLGVANVPGITKVTATETPGSKLWVQMAKLAAQVGDARRKSPECLLMRSARWFYFQGAEDTAERPFGLSTNFYLGSDDATPDPIGGMMGLPVFPDDAISTTRGEGKNQDLIVCSRPRDAVIFEGVPQTDIMREPLSGSGGVRLQMHASVAAITGRRPASVGTLTGSGLVLPAGY